MALRGNEMKRINDNWQFVEEFSNAFLRNEVVGKSVRLPHTVKELPLHYIDHNDYQMISGYHRKLIIDEDLSNKKVFLQFDGAAHIATVYVNQKEMMTHRCGYTGFRVDVTDVIKEGENDLHVKLDSTENPAIPPFGFVIDYLTFGGIYRDVYLDIKDKAYIEDIYVTTPSLKQIHIDLKYSDAVHDTNVDISILDADGNEVLKETTTTSKKSIDFTIDNANVWSIDHPYLYRCIVDIGSDKKEVSFGIRTIEVKPNQFLLNGEEVFIVGLNRHQCIPYVNYAFSDSLQVEDARILKEELHVNMVRTSHYPQSHRFIEACDKMGLLVFTEIPGWQHIGDKEWKKQAIENTREMVMQYRQHPSIVIWGVRINESQDDDDFYRITNDVAHQLDPTRPTSGVRYLEKSSLLEDIYSYNDFSHNGITPGAKAKKDVTSDMNKPLLISESNGHMFPTKAYDSWEKRQEHALRHARVMNQAKLDGEHIGVIQWCMFDYPTHKDFGSGDRICYHGVMDSFRNPKLAAYVYAENSDEEDILEIGSSMDIGDYPAGTIESIYAFTNADEVRLYKNNQFVKSFKNEEFKGLKHGPILIDDTIGKLVETNENFNKRQTELVTSALNAAKKYGFPNLPLKYKAELAWCMMRYKMSFEEGVALYGKYVGAWGADSVEWRFDAIKNNKVVKSVIKSNSTKLHLEVKVSSTTLYESDTYDMSAIRIRLLDENKNVASYGQLPITFEVAGPIELVGPSVTTLEGGMGGTYVKTCGEGKASLTIHVDNVEDVTVEFDIKRR